MMKDENFDELIGNKLNSLHQPYNEGKWDEALKLIEADERKKRYRMIYLSLAVLLLLSGSLVTYWFVADPNTGKNTALASNTPIAAKNKIVAHDAASTPDPHKNNVNAVPVISAPKNNTDAAPVAPVLKNKTNAVKTENNSSEKIAGKEKPVTKEKENTKKLQGENKPVIPLFTQTKDEDAKSTQHVVSLKEVQPVTTTTIEEKTAVIASANNEVAPAKTITEEKTNVGTVGGSPPVLSASANSASADSVKTAATTAPDPTKNIPTVTIPEKENKIVPLWTFHVSAGAAYAFNTFNNPVGGVTYTHVVYKKLSLGVRFDYSLLNAPQNAVRTIVSPQAYVFSLNTQNIDIATTKLHYISMPLFVQYAVSDKLNIQLGLNASYLATVTNQLSSYQVSDNTKKNLSTKKEYGYTDGFNLFDCAIYSGAEFSIAKRISLGAYFNFGLIPVQNTSAGSSNKNINAQFRLIYKPFMP